MNKPPAAERLSETVRAQIERELLTGALAPGTVLDERSLAERFGVSRTPVREALFHLAAHGLLNVVSRVGVVVPKLGIKELLSLLEMLAEMEGTCAKLAAKRMDRKEHKALRDALAACEVAAKAGKPKAYEDANKQFHEAIYAGARNQWAAQQVHGLRLRCASYRRSFFDVPKRLEASLAEHRQVVTAIEAGDEEGARQAMLLHISVGGKGFAELVSSLDPGLFARD